MRLLSSLVAVLGLAFAFGGVAWAADPFRVEFVSIEEQAGRINAVVSAYGPDGKPLTGLSPSNFRATLDGAPLAVGGVQTDPTARAPASIVLLVDLSGSMVGEPITQARLAIQEFVRNLEPADSVALMSFDTTVKLHQDFTTDRALITQVVGRLTAAGDTALYDAVIQATAKATTSPTPRRLVVMLSDGQATVGLDKRAPSLAAAKASGISVVSIGVGPAVDRAYLTELSEATGGRFVTAAAPAALRQAYADLAASIRAQYAVTLLVPPNVDRTVQSKLSLTVAARSESGRAERVLEPLAGAVPPPLSLNITGLLPGQRLEATAPVLPATGVAPWASVEYAVDGAVVHRAVQEPFGFELDPLQFVAGNHVLRITAVDARGRSGEAQVVFIVPAAAGGSISIPVLPLAAIGVALFVAGALILMVRRRHPEPDRVKRQVKPWSTRAAEPIAKPVLDWSTAEPSPPPPPDVRTYGRVVVMDEAAVRGGALDGIREYPIGATPLTLGTGAGCDVVVADDSGRIAAEEARLWVQKGRLVYHKLTTLSAMATEGVTSGWQLLDSGDDIRVGPYRVLFQAEVVAEAEPDARLSELRGRTQDHGMALHEMWPRLADEQGRLASSDGS